MSGQVFTAGRDLECYLGEKDKFIYQYLGAAQLMSVKIL